MRALVTAGGTAEPIDDVRAVTNFSTGRFPVAVAAALGRLGAAVEVLGSAEAAHHAAAAGLEVTRFRSSADLDALITERAADPNVVLHMAAVADYSPVPASGKLASDTEELTVTMRRNAKLIDTFRDRFAPHTFIVAAKLTSGASPAETIAAGYSLLKRTKSSLVIANDLAECRDGQHPCWLLTQEGGALRVEGSRDSVAERIAAFIARRFDVTWSATRTADGHPDAPDVPVLEDGNVAVFADMLDFAADAALLPGLDGNAVVRACPQTSPDAVPLYVTPRQVPKADLAVDDGLVTVVEPAEFRTWVWTHRRRPDAKPSIDTSVQARILAAFGNLDGILHTHECFGAAQITTAFPYPCGAAEEAVEVLAAAAAAGIDAASADVLTVELIHHGFLLGVTAESLAELRAAFAVQRDDYRSHLADVDAADVDVERVVPVIAGADVVGVVGFVDGGVSVHLGAAARGRGVGSVIAAQLAARRLDVVTIDACDVVDYWAGHGFVPSRRDDGLIVCAAPAQGDDLPV